MCIYISHSLQLQVERAGDKTSLRIEAHAQVWHYGDPDQEEQGPGGDSRGG